jgi:ribosomal protein S18 acetylase RimI-like enzyme
MATIAPPRVNLRPARAGDDELLRRVYASVREDELAAVRWSAAEKDAFLRHQFDAQDTHYREHYEGATFDVIEVDGEPVGRLYVARWAEEIRIMDIALLPEHRGRGIGTHILRGLLEEASLTGKRVSIHVEMNNPALRLYERLGFVQAAVNGVYVRLDAQP